MATTVSFAHTMLVLCLLLSAASSFLWPTAEEKLETKKRSMEATGYTYEVADFDELVMLAEPIVKQLRDEETSAAATKSQQLKLDIFDMGINWLGKYDQDGRYSGISASRKSNLPLMLQKTAVAGNDYYRSVPVADLRTQRKACHKVLDCLRRLEELLPEESKNQARILTANMNQQFAETLFAHYQSLSAGDQTEDGNLLPVTMQYASKAEEIFTLYFYDSDNKDLQKDMAQNMQLLAILFSLNQDFNNARAVWNRLIFMSEDSWLDKESTQLCDMYYNAGTTDYHGLQYADAKEKFHKYLNCAPDRGRRDRERHTVLTFLKRIEDSEADMDSNSGNVFADIAYQEKREHIEAFEQWLVNNDVVSPKVEITQFTATERGCVATETIFHGETVIKVPHRLLITSAMGAITPAGRKLVDFVHASTDLIQHALLTLAVIYGRKDPNSFHKPFFDILPSSLSQLPIFWSNEKMLSLEGSPVIDSIERSKAAIENSYLMIATVFPSFLAYVSLDEFTLSWMVVNSRGMELVINGHRETALVPMVDLLNHRTPKSTAWMYDNSLKSVVVVSMGEMQSGFEVLTSYGLKSNDKYLTRYGFTVDNNVGEDGVSVNEVEVVFTSGLSAHTAGVIDVWDEFDELSGEASSRLRLSQSGNVNWKDALALLRLMASSQKEVQDIIYSLKTAEGVRLTRRNLDAPVSLDNERKVFKKFHEICDRALNKYPTSLAADVKKMLSLKGSRYGPEQYALTLVKGEKQVLAFFKKISNFAMTLIDAPTIDHFESLRLEYKLSLPSFVNTYFETVLRTLWQQSSAAVGIKSNRESGGSDSVLSFLMNVDESPGTAAKPVNLKEEAEINSNTNAKKPIKLRHAVSNFASDTLLIGFGDIDNIMADNFKFEDEVIRIETHDEMSSSHFLAKDEEETVVSADSVLSFLRKLDHDDDSVMEKPAVPKQAKPERIYSAVPTDNVKQQEAKKRDEINSSTPVSALKADGDIGKIHSDSSNVGGTMRISAAEFSAEYVECIAGNGGDRNGIDGCTEVEVVVTRWGRRKISV